MGKQKKHMLILLLLLLLLIGGYFGLQAYHDWSERKETEKKQQESIFVTDYESEEILSLSYDYEGRVYLFERNGEEWIYPQDPGINIDEDSLEDMAERIAKVAAEEKIENVTDLSQYGLDNPSRTVAFTAPDGEYVLYLGDYNSVISRYYMYTAGDNTVVYTVNANIYNAFSKDLESLVEEEEISGGDAGAKKVSRGDAG